MREKEVERSKIRSHAATVSHMRSHRVVPSAAIPSPQSKHELRSLAFFKERTAVEWSGWTDQSFWRSLAPSVASTYPSVSLAMVAIGAYHESLETGNAKLRAFSVAQGYKSIKWINEHHSSTTACVLMTHCMITSAFSALLNDHLYYQAIQTQFSLIGGVKRDEFGLVQLLKRQRSRHCQMIDPLPLLREAIIANSDPVIYKFQNLLDARRILEQVLNRVASQAKSNVPMDKSLLETWKTHFGELQHKVDLHHG